MIRMTLHNGHVMHAKHGLPKRLRPRDCGRGRPAWMRTEDGLVAVPLLYRKIAEGFGIATDRMHDCDHFLVLPTEAARIRRAYVHPATVKAAKLERRMMQARAAAMEWQLPTEQQIADHHGIVALQRIVEKRDRCIADEHELIELAASTLKRALESDGIGSAMKYALRMAVGLDHELRGVVTYGDTTLYGRFYGDRLAKLSERERQRIVRALWHDCIHHPDDASPKLARIMVGAAMKVVDEWLPEDARTAGWTSGRGRSRMKWHVYHINCDCAAYDEARRHPPRRLGIRCSLCHRILARIQCDKYGIVEAETAREAVRKAVECKLAEHAREEA